MSALNGISLCMIVKNEENNLHDCLNSIKDFVDEMVLVDTGSTDGTIEIARSFSAKVIELEWEDHFSKARNAGLDQASYSWILMLDADEVISSNDIAGIRHLTESPDIYGFRFELRNYVYDTSLTNSVPAQGEYTEERNFPGYIPQKIVRLFRNDPRIRYRGRVHEVVERSLREHAFPVADSGIPIHHYGKVLSQEKVRLKMDSYVHLGRKKMLDDPTDLKGARDLAAQLVEAGEFREAEAFIAEAFEYFPDDVELNFNKGVALERQERFEDAEMCYKKILVVEPEHLGALNNLGRVLGVMGKKEESLEVKKRAAKYHPENPVVMYNYANLLWKLGEFEGAEENYKIAIELEPKNVLFVTRLGDFYFEQERYSEARKCFKDALMLDVSLKHAALGLRGSQKELSRIPLDKSTFEYLGSKEHRTDESEPAISLCMIVKNAEATIEESIESVQGLYDEVIVLDTGSSDGTVAICENLGAKVYYEEWGADFSAARNKSLEYATSDWVLVLDSDEVLSESDHEAIRTAVRAGEYDGYRLIQRNYTNNRSFDLWTPCKGEYPKEENDWVGYFPSCIVRLFRNDERIRFRGRVHELVEDSIEDFGGRIGECSAVIHHLGYSRDEGDGNREQYMDLNIKKVEERPDDPNVWFELGQQYFHNERYEEAGESFSKAISLQESGGRKVHKSLHYTPESSYNMLGVVMEKLGRGVESLSAYKKALKIIPDSRQVLTNLGIWHEERNKIEEALEYYQRADRLKPNNHAIKEHINRVKEKMGHTESSLSLCMIVKNEEHSLANCLESVKDVMDQIVIVDTGSEDRTIEIAKSYGAEVHDFDWVDDFSAARNESLKFATGDYIIWLDGDDVLTADQAKKLLELKLYLPKDGATAYYLNCYNKVGSGSDFVAAQMRIFPNRPELRFQRRIHEQLIFSIEKHGIKTEHVDITITHKGYSEDSQEEKYLRNRPLLLKELEDNPDDYQIMYFLCRNYFLNEEYESAVLWGKKAMEAVEKDKGSDWYHHIKSKLSTVYLKHEMTSEALKLIEELLEERPDDPVIHFLNGQALAVARQNDEAESFLNYFLRNRDKVDVSIFPVSVSELSLAAYNQLGLIAALKSDYEAAITHCLSALEIDAESDRAHRNIAAAYLKSTQYEEAVRHLEWCLAKNPGDFSSMLNMGVSRELAGDEESAESYYKKALDISPENTDVLVNLGALYYKRGNWEGAEEHFAKAIELDEMLTGARLALVRINAERQNTEYCAEAIDKLEALIKNDEPNEFSSGSLPMRFVNLSLNLDSLGRSSYALLSLEIASLLAPGESLPNKLAGVLSIRLGLFESAVELLEKAVRLDGSDWESFAAMGEAYDHLGKAEAAELCYKTSDALRVSADDSSGRATPGESVV